MSLGHIVLTGAMGVGKSTIGRALALSLGREYIDNDMALLEVTGETARSLMFKDGIDAVRGAESAIFARMLCHRPVAIVSAPASVADNLEAFALAGHTVVYLHCDEHIRAIRASVGLHRPKSTLDAERVDRRHRNSLAIADIDFDTTTSPPEAIAASIVRYLSNRFFGSDGGSRP